MMTRRVSARDVIGEALSIYRRRFPVVAAVGLVLFAPLAVIETVAGVVIHSGLHDGDGGQRASAIVLWLGVALLMFGSALCAGFLDKLVGHEFGHADVPFGEAVRTLPYKRLIAVDIAQAALVGVGAIVGLVPGVFLYTLTCLAGPLVMLGDQGVNAALRRSASLTSKRFGLTLLVVAVPVGIEHELLHALEAWIGLRFIVLLALHAVAALLVLVPVVLCEITLAYELSGERLVPERASGSARSDRPR